MSTTERAPVRIVEGREIPPAGYWTLDPADTQIQLIARHMMVSRVRGFFRGFQGLVTIEAVPEQSAIDVTIARRVSTPATPPATTTCVRATSSTSRPIR